ncbi:MAG: DUF2065 domain-containing protein [Proteobacteria bacterium]|nr:DUF2065 domain-containing protein [Pseudomonadota bacterium]
MWIDFFTALALVFIIEGIMPFCNPAGLRKMFILVAGMDDKKLRFIGLTSMLSGLLLLYLVR